MNGRQVTSLIDYTVMDERVRRWVKDARVILEKMVAEDHHLVYNESGSGMGNKEGEWEKRRDESKLADIERRD